MFVGPCIIVSSYRNSLQDATVYKNSLYHVYMKLNMFRATHRPSSGAQNCTSSLWFCIRAQLLQDVKQLMAAHSFGSSSRPCHFLWIFKLGDIGTRNSFISMTVLSILYIFVSVFPKFETKLMFSHAVPLYF
jgi:hypothetical protein